MSLEELSQQATDNVTYIIDNYDNASEVFIYYIGKRNRAEEKFTRRYIAPVKILLAGEHGEYERVMKGFIDIAFRMTEKKYPIPKK